MLEIICKIAIETCTQNVRVDSDLRSGKGEPHTGSGKGEVGGTELENLLPHMEDLIRVGNHYLDLRLVTTNPEPKRLRWKL